MAGADVGCSDQDPLDVVAELVEVSHHLVEAQGEVSSDVLKHDHWGAKDRDGVADVGPEVSLVLLPQALAGLTERLARVSASENVDGLDRRPVDAGDVTQVGDAGEAVLQYEGRVADQCALFVALLNVGHPRGAGAEHFLNGAVEAAVNSPRTATRWSYSWT